MKLSCQHGPHFAISLDELEALDTTNVVSWSVREKWIDTLFRASATDAVQTTRAVSL